MNLELLAHRIASLAKENATYSLAFDGWTISLAYLEIIVEQSTGYDLFAARSFNAAMELGARIGLWDMNYDAECDTNIVVLR